jgi:cytoskeletal protein RodZ
LGVDGKDAIDRYRYEMAGRRKKPILSMPTPVSEGRAPSGIIMVGAAVVVLLIYGIWYGISSANRTEINMQPALPTTVQPTSSLPTPSEATAAAGLTSPVAVAPTPVTAAPAPVVTPPPAPVVAEAPPPPPPAPVAMAAPVIPPAAPGIVVTADQAGATATAAKDSKDSKKPTVDSKNAIKPVKNDVVADKAADDGKDKKQIYGDPAATSRLIIRATQSSWVMVTDDSGKAVFDHVLKAGDVYKVPNKPGLSLTTGNGNGIVLTLDGADLPRVANGAPHVVRNIALDPDRLTAEPPAATVEH